MGDFEDLVVHLVDPATGEAVVSFDTVKTIPKNSHRQRQCAVEAHANQRFAIQVAVKEEFDWAGCNGLEVKIGFDVGEQVNCRSVYLLKDTELAKMLDLPSLTYNGLAHSYCIDHLLVEHPETGRSAFRAHFYFRQLRGDESVPATLRLPRTLDSQGKIRVEVARTTVSRREQDRGLQVDTEPGYRRQTKQNLLRKGITLEVLLHVDIASGPIEYRGNFRSERPKDRCQQANFDFIYREIGCHDLCVATSDILEVHSSKRKSLGQEGTPDRLSSSQKSSISSATTPQIHTNHPSETNTGFATHAAAGGAVHRDIVAICQEHANTVRAEVDKLDVEIASLKATQRELEVSCRLKQTQQRKLRDLHDQCMAKVQEAIDMFLSAIEDVKEESIEQTRDGKRKRDEQA